MTPFAATTTFDGKAVFDHLTATHGAWVETVPVTAESFAASLI
jgi:hypothetical protein